MFEAPIYSNFVSQRAELGFADAAEAAEQLVGRTLEAGKVRLVVKERLSGGFGDHVTYSASLQTGSRLLPALPVDLVVSPWSAGRSEIGIRPLTRLGGPGSLRARRFLDAAWKVIPSAVEAVQTAQRVEVPSSDLQVAA